MKIVNFKADFFTIAYVFVFSIITYYIGNALVSFDNPRKCKNSMINIYALFTMSEVFHNV